MKSVRQLITHTYIQCYNVNEKAYLFSKERDSTREQNRTKQRDKAKQRKRGDGMVSYLSKSDEKCLFGIAKMRKFASLHWMLIWFVCARKWVNILYELHLIHAHTHTTYTSTISHVNTYIHLEKLNADFCWVLLRWFHSISIFAFALCGRICFCKRWVVLERYPIYDSYCNVCASYWLLRAHIIRSQFIIAIGNT